VNTIEGMKIQDFAFIDDAQLAQKRRGTKKEQSGAVAAFTRW